MIFDNQYGRHMSKNFGILEFANIICQNHLGQVNLHIQFTGLIWASEFTYTIHWPDLGQVNLHIQFTGLIWDK